MAARTFEIESGYRIVRGVALGFAFGLGGVVVLVGQVSTGELLAWPAGRRHEPMRDGADRANGSALARRATAQVADQMRRGRRGLAWRLTLAVASAYRRPMNQPGQMANNQQAPRAPQRNVGLLVLGVIALGTATVAMLLYAYSARQALSSLDLGSSFLTESWEKRMSIFGGAGTLFGIAGVTMLVLGARKR